MCSSLSTFATVMQDLSRRAVTCAAVVFHVIGLCCLAMPTEKDVTCKLGEEIYRVNETWHPIMNTVGDRTCVNCTCMPNGEVSCQAMSCPKPDCEEPRLVEGECCLTCDARDDLIGWPGQGGVAKRRGCTHEGRSFRHLEVFPSNNTSLQPKNDSQCVMCNCFDGKVMCLLQLCIPNPRCKNLVSVTDDCCKKCQEDPGRPDRDFLTLKQSSKRKRPKMLPKGACWWHRSRKDNGSTWNPVVAGKLSCVTCSCKNGDVTCDRKDCPKEAAVTCADDGHGATCDCEACPNKKKSRKGNKGRGKGKGKRKNKKKRKKSPKKKKRKQCNKGKKGDSKSRRKCRAGKKKKRTKQKKAGNNSSALPVLFQADMSLSDVIHKLCLPHKLDLVMYHVKGDSVESVAFDAPGRESVQVIHWKVKRGRFRGDPGSHVVHGLEDFRRDVTVKDIVGAVHKNQIKRVLNMIKRRKRRCKKPCRRKMLSRVIKKVKSTQIDFTKSCGE